jgi:acetoin utilization deacetylase AcuC-like enzyme
MSRVPAFFSEAYAPEDVPSLARLRLAARRMQRCGLVEFMQPTVLPASRLRGLHTDTYVDAFVNGTEPLASSQGLPWSERMRDATMNMLGGQLSASAYALRHGLALNLARGFHHAVPERGMGFCPINGLALVAHCHPDRKVFVIDCDEHGGNGTEEFSRILPNLYTASIFGTRFGCQGGERSWLFPVNVGTYGFEVYESALATVFDLIDRIEPDLVLYQAGADCHVRDPKGRAGLSTRHVFRRDLMVFEAMAARLIPTVFVVAGGYQSPARVAAINANTVRAARFAYSRRYPSALGGT